MIIKDKSYVTSPDSMQVLEGSIWKEIANSFKITFIIYLEILSEGAGPALTWNVGI